MTEVNTAEASAWLSKLKESLPLFGHRNWIVVADAAYPMQANPGIETIFVDANPVDIIQAVYMGIASSSHIQANIYTDSEIAFVAENDAPGISEYRSELDNLFAGCHRSQLSHEQIIGRLDASAKLFRILILKTNMTMPYTSVFFELDCGYWNTEAEARLRSAIESSPIGDR